MGGKKYIQMAGNIKVPGAYLYEVRSKRTVKLTICTLYTVHICVLKYVGVSFFPSTVCMAYSRGQQPNVAQTPR